ncbi:MAG: DNA repair protein RadA [Parachlamydiales bacterium]|jgi:DNA repair protein RadA/Sms
MAVKQKNVWSCNECGHQAPRWLGQCPQCSLWNTLHEETIAAPLSRRFEGQSNTPSKPVRLKEVNTQAIPRMSTTLAEVDRLLGGGLVPGALTLVGGDPGIGKSTLMLQLAQAMAKQGQLVLYVCGEESVEQTSLRAKRLGVDSDNLFLLNETHFSAIKAHIDTLSPTVVIIDSIQIVYKSELTSAPGSVAQVRETAAEFMHLSKGRNIAIFLIGHVTKTGEIAGPRVLEHLVDTVLYFEGDRQHNFRIVRAVKNRFGPTDDVAVFQMGECGLTEVNNPSQLFLEERSKGLIGSAVIPTLEGSRALLIEAQALVTDTVFSTPSRRCTGVDQNRLALLLAVLEKRLRYQMFKFDVFVSIAGGLKIQDPALDLGLLAAIASSLRNHPISPETAVIGEVGLGGEIRSVPRIESRLKECIHMGFRRIILPKRSLKGVSKELQSQIQCVGVEMAEEAVHAVVG